MRLHLGSLPCSDSRLHPAALHPRVDKARVGEGPMSNVPTEYVPLSNFAVFNTELVSQGSSGTASRPRPLGQLPRWKSDEGLMKQADGTEARTMCCWARVTRTYELFVLLYSREFTCFSGYRDTLCVS